MSDDWEYDSPEYAAHAEAAEAAENAAEDHAAEQAGSAPAAEVPAASAEAPGASSQTADSADATPAAESTEREPAASPAPASSLPAPRSKSKSRLPSPRTESTPGDSTPGNSTPGDSTPADPALAHLDDATWQLSTDMAPLPPLRQCLEAILLVVEEPVVDVVLAQITERPRDEVVQTLHELAAEYTEQQRGFDLRQVAGGWRFYTRTACAPLVEKFVLDGQQAKLSQPALETLAVVAYRQPVSRSRISAVRGVNCDGVMRTLLTRGLIEEAGTDADSGAILYRTTLLFLEKMGMHTLDELPALAPLLPSVESMEESETLA
ncbi:chromosome segregation and condensation protein, ScpB [Catenulispora acidiphila DSM 44928]|uniref:Chromosome segregation and condensation protein, ScpB n=1 Tax=Catenulispora acidiphila (strain DSM 44928 / JCM 14897 / NBRC 102108 / NRRL B-24433 / ID139908) TaxID=479433 RepID=C7PVY2_CATAD|nr:SMC-Scp complex subunit ScpB [Catenulispora acidiphila]ACU71374.1 chromosome segregation and condensation protein, ScpB [Catenulispora acidiphila DSM 44928]